MKRNTIGTALKLNLLVLPLLFTACSKLAGADDESASAGPKSVEIGNNRIMMIQSFGRGEPTVVVEAGMGEAPIETASWQPIIDEISKSQRVVIYNRAGLGGSTAPDKVPRTSSDVAADLSLLLDKAKIKTPVVLVAHSFGGIHARVFAARNKQQVAGMVLVDSSHPDQDQKWLAAFPKKASNESPTVTQGREFLQRRQTITTNNPEQVDTGLSSGEARNATGLGAMPLVVLSHCSSYRFAPGLPPKLGSNLEEIAQSLQRDLARLSASSKFYQSANGSHNLHVDDPALVIQAVREVSQSIQK